MLLATLTKQPTDRFDYDFSYKEWLVKADNLESTIVTVLPDDSNVLGGLQIETVIIMDPILKLWISGGKDRTTYKITLTSTTTDGRVRQDEMKLKIKDI
jgi:hypothetical protein